MALPRLFLWTLFFTLSSFASGNLNGPVCDCLARQNCDVRVSSGLISRAITEKRPLDVEHCPSPEEIFCCTSWTNKPALEEPRTKGTCHCVYHRNCDLNEWHRYGDYSKDIMDYGTLDSCPDPRFTLCCPGATTPEPDWSVNPYQAADRVCPCVRRFECPSLPYGTLPTDIRDFGTLPHCESLWDVRCCERRRPQQDKGDGQNRPKRLKRAAQRAPISVFMSFPVCPCVSRDICPFLPYGRVQTDVQEFGQLPHCSQPSNIRCCQRRRQQQQQRRLGRDVAQQF